jgi:hypothetical protein
VIGIAHHRPGTSEGRQHLETLRFLVEKLARTRVELFDYESDPPPVASAAILSLAPGGHYHNVKNKLEEIGARVCGPIPEGILAGHIVSLSLDYGCGEVAVAYWPAKRFSREHEDWIARSATLAGEVLGSGVAAKPYTQLSGHEECVIALSVTRGRLLRRVTGRRIVDGSLLPRSMAAIVYWIARECPP